MTHKVNILPGEFASEPTWINTPYASLTRSHQEIRVTLDTPDESDWMCSKSTDRTDCEAPQLKVSKVEVDPFMRKDFELPPLVDISYADRGISGAFVGGGNGGSGYLSTTTLSALCSLPAVPTCSVPLFPSPAWTCPAMCGVSWTRPHHVPLLSV